MMMMLTSTMTNRLCLLLLLVATTTTCHAFQVALSPRRAPRIATTARWGSNYFDEEDEDDREFARIRQGGRRSRPYAEDEERMLDDLEEAVDDYFDAEEDEFDGLIPNPLLDNIDPEGSAERIPELLSDRQFWIDIALLALFLNLMDNLRDPAVFDAIDLANGFN